ncbi:MAG: GH25 family lysozyme [Pseudotabrizicola sp.]|uniref:GH25 family lysozyme n=1 Tax=Pseudotabrizicola sp. TaxID=2939647 RepID=UPI00272FAB26|nr:GH25 family lysozyme [Pseudotabrizicola sp.]MDP2082383.1 GH25 family lysozyme [Pseudotabrizicola sp.]MDZ7574290.1 GH25 family lysozyme [Pseudotabrizicola sp.]
MKFAILFAAALALSACGGPRLATSDRTSTRPAGAVIAPSFGDRKPHPWDGRAPSAYAVHGTDTSRYQTPVDWVSARANGVNFTFIKATEGADDSDPMFREHWNAARDAGVATGAYHFWYHCANGRAQAQNFIRRVPRATGALPPVLDLEWTPFSPTCTRRPPQAELLAEAQVFIDTVARHYGQMPLVYVSPDIFASHELWRLRGVEFWVRSVAGHPSKVYPGTRWTFWQYSSTGQIPGKTGDADLNAFAGSAADWRDWLARRALK